MNKLKIISIVLILTLVFLSYDVTACKDIIACGDATDGDYNILLKVRDPSRPGLQVLCIVPEGYEYEYHDPWTGKTMSFTTEHKYIGVATQDDVIPNIVKAGMSLSDSGIAYGDADTGSRWINPRKYSWDDFDWIRYACEKADDERQAASLLTEGVVDDLHATGVSENLFIVGPETGFVIEGDAYRYNIQEFENGVAVMSNYPKELWKSQILKKLPVSISFDTVNEKTVRKNGVVRLGSLYGVKVVSIGGDYITAKPVSFGHSILSGSIGVLTDIQIGERETVGKFSVTLLHIDGNKATVRVTNVFKAWEEEMLKYIEPKIGDITVFDMMDWSRLHEGDLDNLRPMCEDTYEYEAVTIYKIPSKDYGTMSLGWFSPNHACSSIYVPFHNSNTDIFDPYKTGEAAQLSLDLLNAYGHDVLTESFMEVETVFQNEMNSIEDKSNELSKQDLSDFLTYFDMGMQEQAYITQTLWLEANNKSEITSILDNIWNNSYLFSLFKIRNSMNQLDKISNSKVFKEKIAEIAISISDSYMNGAKLFNEDVEHIEDLSESGKKLIRQGEYEEGIDSLIQSFSAASGIIFGNEAIVGLDDNPIEEDDSVIFYILLIFLLFVAFAFLLRKMQIQF